MIPQKNAKNSSFYVVANSSNDEKGFADNVESEECKICFGTGLEVVAGKGARTCECRNKDPFERRLEKARIPQRYLDCHFQNYNAQNKTQVLAKGFASKLANEFPGIDRGLLLMGSVGVGKTHLAVSIIKCLAERGFSSLFYEFGSLLKEIQDSYNPKTQASELKILSNVFDADVLVLDEIGASKPTDWVRDTMSHIINTRYNDKKLTIFTTNYLDVRDSDKEETLEDRIGVRMRSRLFEMCRTIKIDGGDFRQTFDRPSK